MKCFLTSLLFFYTFNIFSDDLYKFEQYDLNGNLTQEGKIFAIEKNADTYKFEVDVTGVNFGYEFTSSHKISDGLNIWDIHDRRDVRGISIFTWKIDPKLYLVGYETKNIKTLDQNHPFFKSQGWVFHTKVKKEESLSINDKTFETIFFHTHGERPTGPTHPGGCYYNQTGVIEVSSWYEKNTGKLLKQVFDKRHCTPESHRLLSKEIISIQ